MGVCQTVCGAATSGKGLSGIEIAQCLTHAIKNRHAKKKDENEVPPTTVEGAVAAGAAGSATAHTEPTADDHTPPHSSRSDGPQQHDDKPATTFDEVREYSVEMKRCGGSDSDTAMFHIRDYAPDAFAILREVEGITEEHFLSEFNLTPTAVDMALGEGRSMALFLKSKHMDFMCKTISAVEVEVLMGTLEQYVKHVQKNKDTLLMRFVMLFSVEVEGEIGYILCFSDIFSTCREIHEKWDLKGRVPKPGKYRHFAEKEKYEKKHLHPDDMDNNSKGVDPGSPASIKLITRKDKDLSRLFWVPEQKREPLLQVLSDDYSFLCRNGLMDYSLLIGVRYNNHTEGFGNGSDPRSPTPAGDDGAPTTSPPTSPGLKMRLDFPIGEKPVFATESRPKREGKCNNHANSNKAGHYVSSCQYHQGLESLGSEEMYFIGIIDMLTVYNSKKMSANFFKTFLWKTETLSTIPPEEYRQRIHDYTLNLFPALQDDER